MGAPGTSHAVAVTWFTTLMHLIAAFQVMLSTMVPPKVLFKNCLFKTTMKAANKMALLQSTCVYIETKSNQEYRVDLIDAATIRLASKEWQRVKRGLFNHASVGAHPHLARFLDVDYSAPYIAIKTEHAKQTLRDLQLRMGPLPEVVSQWLLLQLLHAVDYCHGSGICNCDIRPANILVTYSASKKPIIKLANFACSKRQEPGASLQLSSPFNHRHSLGDIAFMAPEILQQLLEGSGEQATGGVHYDGASVDVWCMGVVLYYMLFNRLPFVDQAGPRRSLLEQVKFIIARSRDGDWVVPSKPAVSAGCVDVLKKMLAPRHSRCSLKDLWQHPWILERLPPNARAFNEELRGQQLEKKLTARLSEVLDHCESALAATVPPLAQSSKQ